jgi:hypothetical protein
MRPLFAFVAAVSALTACVELEAIPVVIRLPSGMPTLPRYRVELWRGGVCPTPGDAFAGLGTGGTLVEAKDGPPESLTAFGELDDGALVLFALGFTRECEPIQYGCTAFEAGEVSEVVVAIDDSGWDVSGDECPGMLCTDASCVPDPTVCTDIAVQMPETCTIPANCGPSFAFDCLDQVCTPKTGGGAAIELDITRGLDAEVTADRFALVEEATDFVHVMASITVGGTPESLNVWTAPAGDLTAGTVASPPGDWMLDRTYAVAARDYAGSVYMALYDQEPMVAIKVGEMDGSAFINYQGIGPSTLRSGVPAFTGTGGGIRQFWYGESPDRGTGVVPELASVSRAGAVESVLYFNHADMPAYSERNEIIGSRGDYALMPTSTPESFFLVHSYPEYFDGAAEIPDMPQRETFAGIGTERPAFVHLGGDRYLLLYPNGRQLVPRYATCAVATCTFDSTNPTPIPIGNTVSLLRAEALFDETRLEGVAVAYLRTECGTGSLQVELLLLDGDALRPAYHTVLDYTLAQDVELAVVHTSGAWRVYVAWLESHDTRGEDIAIQAFDF